MKLTEQRTPYLLVDFTDEIVGNNVVLIHMDEQTTTLLNNYKTTAEEVFQKLKKLHRLEFKDRVGNLLKIDVQKESVLRDWFLTHKGRYMYLEATQEEIDRTISELTVCEVDQSISVFMLEGKLCFTISLVDPMHNSIIEFLSRDVYFSEIGIL